MKEGLLLILSGPSGSGKDTLINHLRENDTYAISISMTTREQREGEINGVHYIFCNEDEFMKTRDAGGLLEHATFVGNYYGTPVSYVYGKMAEGKTVVLEIDVVGALQIKERFPEAILIFIIPPCFKELKQRLITRGRENLDEIERRIKKAEEEIAMVEKYNYLVINDDIHEAVYEVNLIVRAELLKSQRSMEKIENFYKGEQI